MALAWKVLWTPLVAWMATVAGASNSTAEKLNAFYHRYLEIGGKDGLPQLMQLVAPDAKSYITSGSETFTPPLRHYFDGYKTPLTELVEFDSRWVVLKASGPFVSLGLTNFGVFANGCKFNFFAFLSLEFNEAGQVVYMLNHHEDIGNFPYCAKGGPTPGPRPLVLNPQMPKGCAEFYEAWRGLKDEGGVDYLLSRVASDATVHDFEGSTKSVGSLRDKIEGYRTAYDQIWDWQTNWQPLVTTERVVTFSFADVGIFKNGCKFDIGGYIQVTFDDEGKVTHMFQHVHDLGAFPKCAAKQSLVAPPTIGGGTATSPPDLRVKVLVAYGLGAGILFTLAALVVTTASQRWPSHVSPTPLLE